MRRKAADMAGVLITGGSSGIGFELARCFCEQGHTVLINGADLGRLLQAKQGLEREFGQEVHALHQDLSLPGGAECLYKAACETGLAVDILINNAGRGLVGSSEEIDPAAEEDMMRLNMLALVQLCKLYLRDMYKRGGGRILNVASVAAFQPGPYNASYYASKAFVASYSRAIRYEAKKRGVEVCVLYPGSTNTDFFAKEGIAVPRWAKQPQKVAQYAYKKLMRGRGEIVPGRLDRLARLVPSGLKIGAVARMKSGAKKQES